MHLLDVFGPPVLSVVPLHRLVQFGGDEPAEATRGSNGTAFLHELRGVGVIIGADPHLQVDRGRRFAANEGFSLRFL